MQFEDVRLRSRSILAAGGFEAARAAEGVWRQYIDDAPSQRDRGMALGALAEVVAMQGRVPEAQELFAVAAALVEQPKDRLTVAVGHAQVLAAAKLLSAAAPVVSELELLLAHPDALRPLAAWGFSALSRLWLLQGRPDLAEEAAQAAVRTAQDAPGKPGMAEALSALAAAQEALGDLATALQTLEEAMTYMSSGHCLTEARAEHARLALQLGQLDTARASLRRAVELPDLRDRRILARILRIIATLYPVDPQTGAHLSEMLAAHLEGTLPFSSGEVIT